MSPIQFIPKKTSITMVKNNKGDLILTSIQISVEGMHLLSKVELYHLEGALSFALLGPMSERLAAGLSIASLTGIPAIPKF